jgi:hypothetical protein
MQSAINFLYIVGSSPSVPKILNRMGKRYIFSPVPKGLPRYRTVGECHRNSQCAVLDDDRLTYVEGAALSSLGVWMGHAWVTMDGVHAIDLTWRGQQVSAFRPGARDGERIGARSYKPDDTITMHPAVEYIGVEIPTKDIAKLMCANQAHGFFLDQWAAQREAA